MSRVVYVRGRVVGGKIKKEQGPDYVALTVDYYEDLGIVRSNHNR